MRVGMTSKRSKFTDPNVVKPGSRQGLIEPEQVYYSRVPITRNVPTLVKFFQASNDEFLTNLNNGKTDNDFRIDGISINIVPGINPNDGTIDATCSSHPATGTQAVATYNVTNLLAQYDQLVRNGVFQLEVSTNKVLGPRLGLHNFPAGGGGPFVSGQADSTLAAGNLTSLVMLNNGDPSKAVRKLRTPIVVSKDKPLAASIKFPAGLNFGNPGAGAAGTITGYIMLELHGVELRGSNG